MTKRLFILLTGMATTFVLPVFPESSDGRAIEIKGTPLRLVFTNAPSLIQKNDFRDGSTGENEIDASDSIEFFFSNSGTNVHRLMTLRPKYTFSCVLWDSMNRAIPKNVNANGSRVDPPKLTTKNVGRYLQPINVVPKQEPRRVLFTTDEVFRINKPGRYSLELALYHWSKSNTLCRTDSIRLPIIVRESAEIKR